MKHTIRLLSFLFMSTIFLQLTACMSSQKAAKSSLARVECVRPFDVIIVPGIPFNNGTWDSVMKARVLWSYFLYKKGYTRNVIYSGAAVYSPYFEGKIMALYAEQLGIPKEHIFYEIQARHSTENIYFSYLLAKEKGFKSIALATDPFQSAMLRRYTDRRFETPIYHLPFITDTIRLYNHLSPTIDPTSAKAETFTSITEHESMWQRLRGTMGRDIDWKCYKHGTVPKL